MRLDTTHDADGLVARHWTILEKSLGVLRQGFDPRRGDRIACIHEVGDDLEVEWLDREAAAHRLRKLSDRAGGLRGFRELAQRLVWPPAARANGNAIARGRGATTSPRSTASCSRTAC